MENSASPERTIGVIDETVVSLGKANFGANGYQNGCLSKIEPFADVDGDIAALSLYSYEPQKFKAS